MSAVLPRNSKHFLLEKPNALEKLDLHFRWGILLDSRIALSFNFIRSTQSHQEVFLGLTRSRYK
jgi:hypothetical protein